MWILLAILSYFFLALSSLADRYLLAGPLPNPKVYTFLVGVLGIFALVLFPFGFEIPAFNQILLNLLAGAIWILAIFLLYSAIYHSEVSRVVPAIGGFLPIFTFIFSLIFFPGQAVLTSSYISALLLLALGSFLITFEKEKLITLKSLKFSIPAALAFAIGFSLMKLVYLEQPFISGFIWMRLGGVLAGILFLVFPGTRQIVFRQKLATEKRVSLPFILGQVCGGTGFILQNYSVVLAKASQIPLINALEGIRYVFLLFFVFILGRKLPQLLKEEISKRALLQKTFAILLIGAGLALLAFK